VTSSPNASAVYIKDHCCPPRRLQSKPNIDQNNNKPISPDQSLHCHLSCATSILFHPYIRPPETPNQLWKLVLLLIESAGIMSSQPRPQLQTNKGQPYQPISGNSTRLQPHPVDQDPLTIDQRLYSANSAISESLNILSFNHNTITSLTRTCTTYQQRLDEWSKAYTALEIEHKKTSTDLENMTRNHLSISQQLKEASQYYKSNVQEYERKL
jgi:hypothetical protein